MSKTAQQLAAEIRAFLKEQKKFGGSYRDASGNYSPERNDRHNDLVRQHEIAKRTARIERQQARWRAAGKI